ncbi:hypothetical protein [Desulfosarcina cetonica]|uniref:hypothetical protein n=1 Tax=Desulfosarcina cetonica TaxID=90730 RepID=UPI0006D1ABB8|nr:hypothetical protein [Desulfosarcina cetonica]
MVEPLETIEARIEAISLALVTLDGEDIPVMGQMLNDLGDLKTFAATLPLPDFGLLVGAVGVPGEDRPA